MGYVPTEACVIRTWLIRVNHIVCAADLAQTHWNLQKRHQVLRCVPSSLQALVLIRHRSSTSRIDCFTQMDLSYGSSSCLGVLSTVGSYWTCTLYLSKRRMDRFLNNFCKISTRKHAWMDDPRNINIEYTTHPSSVHLCSCLRSVFQRLGFVICFRYCASPGPKPITVNPVLFCMFSRYLLKLKWLRGAE